MANKFVDTEKPWELAKAAKLGDAAAEEKLRGVLGDLLESCRLISLYAGPAMPSISAKIWTLLGRTWPYDASGHNGPSLDEIGAWGALGVGGPLGAPEPLFPRLEADALDAAAD
jgi:methionyl-tRNA synthetase